MAVNEVNLKLSEAAMCKENNLLLYEYLFGEKKWEEA
jgi:hypothetical protein